MHRSSFFFILIFFANIFYTNTTNAQGIAWLNEIEGGNSLNNLSICGIVADSQGYSYITGSFSDGALLDTTTLSSSGDQDIFIAKLNPLGQAIWIKTAGGNSVDLGFDIELDESGGIFVSGIFTDSASFDSIQVYRNYSSNFLAKYDTNGAIQWIKTGANTTGNNLVKSKLKYQNGFVYFAAFNDLSDSNSIETRTFDGYLLPDKPSNISPSNTVKQSFIFKTDVNGTNQWIRPFQANNNNTNNSVNIIEDIQIKSNNHVVAQCFYTEDIDIDATTFLGPANFSIFTTNSMLVVELDQNGSLYQFNALAPQLGPSYTPQFASGIAADDSDNTYLVYQNRFNSTLPLGFTVSKLDTALQVTQSIVLGQLSNNLQAYFKTLEVKNQQVILGGDIRGTINVGGSSFYRLQESVFINLDSSLTNLNWLISSASSPPNNSSFSSRIIDCYFGPDNGIYFSGETGADDRSFGDYDCNINSINNGFALKLIGCNPTSASISPINPVICGVGSSITLTANYNNNLNINWFYEGVAQNGITNNTFITANPGNYLIEIDSFGCKDTTTNATVLFSTLPSVSTPPNTINICSNGSVVPLLGGSPSNGIWSGFGVVNDSLFDPAIVGSGPTLLTYTYTNALGCSNDAVQIANVVPPPALLLNTNIPDFCTSDTPYELTPTVFPAGGSYSGPGVVSNDFNPNIAGVGTHPISYSYTAADGCSSSINFTLTVNAAPVVSFPAFNPLCQSNFVLPLNTASPSGGIYDGPFVISNNFYPFLSGAGSFPVIYSVSQNGCTQSDTQIITIDPIPQANLALLSDFCIDNNIDTLVAGSPTGGLYTINGTPAVNINPAGLGNGTFLLEYTISNSCGSAIDSQTFKIWDLPNINLPAIGPFCVNSSPQILNVAIPTGGIYSGPGITNNTLNTSTLSAGTYTIFYSYVDSNSCAATDSTLTTINSAPNASSSIDSLYCNNNNLSTLNASPSGGIWSGNGIIANNFKPDSAGLGLHTLQYAVVNSLGCTDTLFRIVEVKPLPSVNFSALSPICNSSSSAVVLTGGLPINGTYSGPSVSNGFFDPSVSGSGFFTIQYTYTDTFGCSNSSNQILTVDTTNVNLSQIPFGSICNNTDSLILSGGSPNGGFYSGDGVIANTFYPGNVGVGSTVITYSYIGPNACIATVVEDIIVDSVPIVNLAQMANQCTNDSVFNFTGGQPSGGNYNFNGILSSTFDPQIGFIGTNTLQYNFTDNKGCTGIDSISFEIFNLTATSINPINSCINDDQFVLNVGNPIGGNYTGIGVNDSLFAPQIAGIGSNILIYSFQDSNGCINADTTISTVFGLPNATITGQNTICQGDSVTLTSSTTANYLWSTADSAASIIIQPDSSQYYYLNLIDSNNCTAIDSIEIIVNTLELSIDSFEAACFGEDGIAIVSAIGSASTYLYDWSDGNTTDTLSAPAGNYCVTVIDNNGCQEQICTSISAPQAVQVAVIDLGNGTAMVNASGGSIGTSYQYIWSNGQTDSLATGLVSGSNCVTVSDDNGCSDSSCLNIISRLNAIKQYEDNLNLFPNPTSNRAFLQLNLAASNNLHVQIFDALGQKIYSNYYAAVSNERIELPTKNYPAGVYWIRCRIGTNLYSKQLIIQR